MKKEVTFLLFGSLLLLLGPGTMLSEQTKDGEEVFSKLSSYEKWLEAEGIPVYKGSYAHLNEIQLKPWKRVGGLGAYIVLEGTGGTVDAFVCEIPAGGKTNPEKHLFEENIMILSGEGETKIWQEKGKETVVRWRKGSVFSPPLNTWHQHFNIGDQPARFAAVTNAPILIDIFRNVDFIFNNSYVFSDRYKGEGDYFNPERDGFKIYRTPIQQHATRIVNFIPDAFTCRLYEAGQGVGDIDCHFALSGNTMASHVEQFPVGTYEKAHRHGPGSTIIILSGRGYTLMWPPEIGIRPFEAGKGDKVLKVDWREGTLLIPPLQWFHQHFNSGDKPARFIKLGGWGNERYPFTTEIISDPTRFTINYEEEDPKIREIFEEELKKVGLKIEMPHFSKSKKE